MILFRYLTRETLVTMFAVSFTLLVIVMSGRLVKYLAQAAAGDLAPDVLASIMLFRIPSFLELVLPLGLFIGILLAYGRLYVESEMTVMSACGLSTKRLSLYTLVPALLVAVAVGFMSMVASPYGIAKVQDIFDQAKKANSLETIMPGRFRVEANTGRATYVAKVSDDNRTMFQVFTAEPRKGTDNELVVVVAEQGRIGGYAGDDGRFLILNDGYRYMGKPGEAELQVTHFAEYGQRLKDINPAVRKHKKTDARTLRELVKSRHLEDKATLQWRVSLAILVPIIALIAQALSRTNHRRGRYVKMLPAFLVYIVYLVMLNAARDAIEKGDLPLAVGMWWVHGLFLLLAALLLFGGDWLRWLKHRGGRS